MVTVEWHGDPTAWEEKVMTPDISWIRVHSATEFVATDADRWYVVMTGRGYLRVGVALIRVSAHVFLVVPAHTPFEALPSAKEPLILLAGTSPRPSDSFPVLAPDPTPLSALSPPHAIWWHRLWKRFS
jgi:mannose-6-phosphate isomerase-like protein (cupin superfamily)